MLSLTPGGASWGRTDAPRRPECPVTLARESSTFDACERGEASSAPTAGHLFGVGFDSAATNEASPLALRWSGQRTYVWAFLGHPRTFVMNRESLSVHHKWSSLNLSCGKNFTRDAGRWRLALTDPAGSARRCHPRRRLVAFTEQSRTSKRVLAQ